MVMRATMLSWEAHGESRQTLWFHLSHPQFSPYRLAATMLDALEISGDDDSGVVADLKASYFQPGDTNSIWP